MNPLAIHDRSGSFSDRWIQYCVDNGIPFRRVDCHHDQIVTELHGCSALLWHMGHGSPVDLLMARHVFSATEAMGLPVFPNHPTQWHFDDKVAQKYLLEAIGAPHVPTHVFYELNTARHWIEQATFPVVFKLRRGSGSRNVRLVSGQYAAYRLAVQAFTTGFRASSTLSGAAWKVGKAARQGTLVAFLRGAPGKIANRLSLDFFLGLERGYLLFQEFMAGNDHDTRVTVIGERAFGFRRRVRQGDFRASGSGQILYGPSEVDAECVRTAFDVAARIGSQSMAFDFVKDGGGRNLIVEMSFGYASKPVYDCGGYWDRSLRWHDSPTWPEHAIIEDVLAALGLGAHRSSE